MKSQIDKIFLILFIFAIILTLGFTYLYDISPLSEIFNEEESVSSYGILIQEYVEECITKTGLQGITYISKEGKTIVIENSLSEKTNLSIKEELELEIAEYVDEYLTLCTNNFSKFLDLNVSSSNSPQSQVKISENYVNITTYWPLVIHYRNKEEKINIYSTNIEVKLGFIHNLITDIFNSQEELCFDCLINQGQETNIYTSFDFYNEEDLLIIILEETGLLDKIPLKHIFMIKTSLNEEELAYLANYSHLQKWVTREDVLA